MNPDPTVQEAALAATEIANHYTTQPERHRAFIELLASFKQGQQTVKLKHPIEVDYHQASEDRPLVKQVIIVRQDLNMRTGDLLEQAARAAVLCCLDASVSPEMLVDWMLKMGLMNESYLASSLEELLHIEQRAEAAGIYVARATSNRLAGRQGIPTRTCCALGPAPLDALYEITQRLRVTGHHECAR